MLRDIRDLTADPDEPRRRLGVPLAVSTSGSYLFRTETAR